MASNIAYNYRLEIMGEVYQSAFLEQAKANTFGNQIAERDYQVAARDGDISSGIASDRPRRHMV